MGNESYKNQLIYEEREKTKSIFLDSSSIEIRSFLVSQTIWTSKFKCTVYNVDIVSFCWFRLYICILVVLYIQHSCRYLSYECIEMYM